MEDMKTQIELKLIATQLSDWCKHREGIIFQSFLCTQERILRFQTPLLQEVFPNAQTMTGAWKSGRFFMYEIYNAADEFKITCTVSMMGLDRTHKKRCQKLLDCCKVSGENGKGLYFLQEWKYPDSAGKYDKILAAMEDFSEFEMPYFETELAKWKEDTEYHIKEFPKVDQVSLPREEMPEEIFVEGGMKDILTNKYERNISARKKCIAVHGTACNICGFDFGSVYGEQFAGKIHVHHRVPLSEIKEDYVVDPVKDLIPVCPNCHMILHSKSNGVYTVEEVKKMLEA